MVIEPIFKTFLGRHIDLSKVVAISDARLTNKSYKYYVGFEIHVQLLDKPLIYERTLVPKVEIRIGNEGPIELVTQDGKLLCEINLQKQIDELIEQWKAVRRKYS